LGGRYEVIKCIGRGGTCAVYKALDHNRLTTDDDNPCIALKIPHQRFRENPEWLRSFEREAVHSLQLRHPNIVKVFGYYHDATSAFIAMEFLPGTPLSERMRSSTFSGLSWADAEPIISAMSKALNYAHAQGVVHCDVKPSNVFITDGGEIKLIDFGISQLINSDAAAPQRPREATPGYGSPAVLAGLTPHPRDDVYSLACVAYELLTGKHPFDHRSATEARDARLTVPRRGLSKATWEVFKRALAFEDQQRTAKTVAFGQALTRSYSRTEPALKRATILVGVLALLWLTLKLHACSDKLETANELATTDEPTGHTQSTAEDRVTPDVVPTPSPQRLDDKTTLTTPGSTAPSVSQRQAQVAEAERIAELLDLAAQRRKDEKLVTPANESAMVAYRQVLALDPENAAALHGLRELKAYFTNVATKARREGQRSLASEAVDGALLVDPEDQQLQGLRRELLLASDDTPSAPTSEPVRTTALADQRQPRQPKETTITSQTEEAVIDGLLARAQRQLAAGNLTPPNGDSAWATYQQVLHLDPSNREATLGKQRVLTRMMHQAKRLYTAGKVDQSTTLITQALALSPGDPELRKLQAEIQRYRHQEKTMKPAASASVPPQPAVIAEPVPPTPMSTVTTPPAEPSLMPARRARHSATF
jgi:serine/threonine protein kinase